MMMSAAQVRNSPFTSMGATVRKLTIDSGHDEANLRCVGGTGEVGVDLLSLVLVQANKAVKDVVASRSIVVATLVVGEVVLHRADGQLLLEAINLVEEQNDRRLDEPSGVTDAVEQSQSLLHTVDRLVLEQELIVFRNSHEEKDGSDVLETMNPLLPLGSLATNIEHAIGEITNDEGRLGNTGRLHTRSENVLVIGHVIRSGNTGNVVEVTGT